MKKTTKLAKVKVKVKDLKPKKSSAIRGGAVKRAVKAL